MYMSMLMSEKFSYEDQPNSKKAETYQRPTSH